jgi:hypothetical protein
MDGWGKDWNEKLHMKGLLVMEYILLAALVLHAWRNVL